MKSVLLKLLRAFGRVHCRCRGARLGRGVMVHGLPRIRIRRGGELLVGDGVTINSSAWSNPFNTRPCRLHVGEDARLELGERAGISGVTLVAQREIRIGEGTLVGAGTLITDSDMHGLPLADGGEPATAPVIVGRQVFIGAHCIVLKGTTIGDGAVVGAGSVVVGEVPPQTMVAGVPARIVRRFKS